MPIFRECRRQPVRKTDLKWIASALVGAVALWPAAAGAQLPTTNVLDGVTSPLPRLPEEKSRPATGPDAVTSFVDSLSRHDGVFEVNIGQGRLLLLKEDLPKPGPSRPVIAVGDPSIIEFVVVGPRQIRIIGIRLGTTDLSIFTADNKSYSFEVQVVAELDVLRAQLKQAYPDANLKLGQIREHIVVEGQARDAAQVGQIIRSIQAYLESLFNTQLTKTRGQAATNPTVLGSVGSAPSGPGIPAPPTPMPPGATPAQTDQNQNFDAQTGQGGIVAGTTGPLDIQATITPPRIINLIRVPGSQQVLLKVRVAELNRTALRQIGANFLGIDPKTGAIVGSQIGGSNVTANATAAGFTNLKGVATSALSGQNTVFGIFQDANFEFMLSALRQNSVVKILAEPNLVALNGQQSSFLAGGEFPVPVPQVSAAGVAPTITVLFKKFGVQLDFVPFVLDNDVVRLTVDPVVSQIDRSTEVTLVAGGSPIPGLTTRQAHTTVELRQGQTLAIAGLLQLMLDSTTTRIPGLGDLPILGPFFSNTTGLRTEKELVVLVTPYLIEPMNREQVPPGPGDEVGQPNDIEFYFLNRIEGRTGHDWRSTTEYADTLHLTRLLHLESKYVRGPCGFSN
jgi:pilus assembly protein CpaC